jgi:hypothetical protein
MARNAGKTTDRQGRVGDRQFAWHRRRDRQALNEGANVEAALKGEAR